jgi:hypothetical protein
LSRPSDPILRWFRKILKERDVNIAMLAKKIHIPRARVRGILSGKEDMSLDQLIQFSEALGLSQEDLAAADLPTPATLELGNGDTTTPEHSVVHINPWANQPEQLFRVAFALGCNFFFLTRTELLRDSGIPPSVLERYADKPLPIKLDAAYHAHNKPQYREDGIHLTLSFDTLYECSFPWSSIIQIVFFPATMNNDDVNDSPDDASKLTKHPYLRLVT